MFTDFLLLLSLQSSPSLVNNCVGLLNYRYFCNFILSCAALCFVTVVSCSLSVYHRWNQYDDPGYKFAYNVPSFFVGIIAFMLFLTLASFWCYHCGLAMNGTTTRENLKFQRQTKENRLSQRLKWLNLIISWCGPLQPSFVYSFFFFSVHGKSLFSE